MTGSGLRKSAVGALALGVIALNACAYWHGDLERLAGQEDRDFRRDPSKEYKEVNLRHVLANASAYNYMDIRFDAIMNRVGESAFIPFWTTVLPENYLSFSAWPSDARLWNMAERKASHPLLFVRKDNPGIQDVVQAPRFSWVRISGRVIGDFEQMAWIDVNRVEVVEEGVYTEEALGDMKVGYEAMAANKPAVAIQHLESSLAGVWTTSNRLAIHLDLARLYEARGDLEAALSHYEDALINDPVNVRAEEGVERVLKAMEQRRATQTQP